MAAVSSLDPSSTTRTSASQFRSAMQESTRSKACSILALSLYAGMTILSCGCGITVERAPAFKNQISTWTARREASPFMILQKFDDWNGLSVSIFPDLKRFCCGRRVCAGNPGSAWPLGPCYTPKYAGRLRNATSTSTAARSNLSAATSISCAYFLFAWVCSVAATAAIGLVLRWRDRRLHCSGVLW